MRETRNFLRKTEFESYKTLDKLPKLHYNLKWNDVISFRAGFGNRVPDTLNGKAQLVTLKKISMLERLTFAQFVGGSEFSEAIIFCRIF